MIHFVEVVVTNARPGNIDTIIGRKEEREGEVDRIGQLWSHKISQSKAYIDSSWFVVKPEGVSNVSFDFFDLISGREQWRRHGGEWGVRTPPLLFRPLLGLAQIRWKVFFHI